MHSRNSLLHAALAVLLIALLAGCSKKASPPTAPQDWPSLTGFLLVTRGPASFADYGQLLRQNLSTGTFETISGVLRSPLDVVVRPDGKTYVLETLGYAGGCDHGCGAVVRLDAPDVVTVIADSLPNPRSFAFEASGSLLVASVQAEGAVLRRVDLGTGAKSVLIAPTNQLRLLGGLAVSADGSIFACAQLSEEPTHAIIRINAADGTFTIVARGSPLYFPGSLLFAPDGKLLVLNAANSDGSGGITKVDVATGSQTVVVPGTEFYEPGGFDLTSNGDILVLDRDHYMVRIRPGEGPPRWFYMPDKPGWPTAGGFPTGIKWRP